MRNTPIKDDNVGDVLPAANFNAINSELENAITTAGGTLNANAGPDTNLFMVSQAMAQYASGAGVYQDSGSADSYVLGLSTTLKPIIAYLDNTTFLFKAGNSNTGASTINVNSLGVKDLTLPGGGVLPPDSIYADKWVQGVYKLSDDRVELVGLDYGVNIDSIATLKTIDGAEIPKVTLTGYYASGDGGGGDFYWDSTSTETDNGGTIIKATAVTTGRWKRIFSGRKNVRWFGARADGTDDVSFFELAATLGEVYAPAGTYSLSNWKTSGAFGLNIYGDGQRKTTLDFELVTSGTGFELGETVPNGGSQQITVRDLAITDSRGTSLCDNLIKIHSGPIGASPSRATTAVSFENVFILEHNNLTGKTIYVDNVSHLSFRAVRAGNNLGSQFGLFLSNSLALNTGVYTFEECIFAATETAIKIVGDGSLLDTINFIGCGIFAQQLGTSSYAVIIDGTISSVSAVNFIGNHINSRSGTASVKITGKYRASTWRGNHISGGTATVSEQNLFGFLFSAAELNAVSFEDNELLFHKSQANAGFGFWFENDCVLDVSEPVSIKRVWRNITSPVILGVETGGNHDDIWNGLDLNTLEVDRVYTIDTDNVVTIKAPVQQGIISVVRQGDLSNLSGALMYQVDSGGAAVLSMAAGTNFNITTGVLNGTTGTNTTVAAHTDGNIYIENRDSSGVYRVKFFNVSAF